eukprot:2709791-Rhodomonas_salina.4
MLIQRGFRKSICWYVLFAATMLQAGQADEPPEGECVMFVQVSEDVEGRSSVRVLEEGIAGHWTAVNSAAFLRDAWC